METPLEKTSETTHVVADDWSANWHGSVAIKITALVVWIVVICSFTAALIFLNNISAGLKDKIHVQADHIFQELMLTDYQSEHLFARQKIEKILAKYGFTAIEIDYGHKKEWVGEKINISEKNKLTPIKHDLSDSDLDGKYNVIGLTLYHVPIDELEQRKKVQILLIIAMSIFGFGFIHVFITSRVLAKPFQALEKASQMVINGDFSIRMDARRQDEFGRLARFFNNMLDRIHKDKDEIDSINQNLESIVNERTKELKQANKELKKTLEFLQETQIQLVKSEREAEAANQSKSLFLANMSHEIRTPLNAILGYTQILQRDSDLNGDHRSFIESIHKSSNHLLGLINDVLDISKIEVGKMKLNLVDFNLHKLILDISDMFKLRCKENKLHWRIDTCTERQTHAVEGDERKLRQVLINLLSNAVKFTSEGSVTLKYLKKEGNLYCFEVIDTGPGINEQAQKTIFDTFQQDELGTKHGGSGLGLAISKKHIELMGGTLEVESKVGQGARFYFTIPLPSTGRKLPLEKQEEKIEVSQCGHVKALVVDDIKENRIVLYEMLAKMGLQVEQAEDGHSAVFISEQLLPDIIFMDYRMPVINGLEAIARIKQRIGNTFKTVIVTATAFEQEMEKFKTNDIDDVITKPFEYEDISGCLIKLLNTKFHTAAAEQEQITDDTPQKKDLTIPPKGIPASLNDKMKEAAEFSIITDIEELSDQIRQLGEEYQPLSDEINKLTKNFDMDAILELAKDLCHE